MLHCPHNDPKLVPDDNLVLERGCCIGYFEVSILPRTPELQRRMDTLGLRKSSIKCAPPSHPRHLASTAHMPLRR